MTASASPEPQRRILVAVDVEKYSRRENLLQYRIQEDFHLTLAEAAERLGLDRGAWLTQAAGDGELAVLPAAASEPRVVAHLATTLDELLRARNAGLPGERHIRVRVAVHVGLVHLDGALGFPGAAAVVVSRLVDARPLKLALAAFPAAGAALIVSEQVYDDVVAQRYEDLAPEAFTPVRIELADKGFDQAAWVRVPGAAPLDLARVLADFAPSAPPPAGPAASGNTYRIDTLTTNGPAVFGDHGRAVSINQEPSN
ncbi:hypothetical protein ACPPVO_48205 [Dactylosporangium sp. McL0621]|uniref:hypothetical protein n=1 Tax=Dactylosporangium sp. McL0621 TaxID=3415678 RepID=UPI003CF1E7DE